ncbi:MAG: non-ribosomal peptide synthase/polyketide synthase [Blastochloris sp.]|nr:non-ribosomal peptide synthase/polyketide synthase [Blastochloris sp.]
MADESTGDNASPATPLQHVLEINGQIAGGCLSLSWTYSTAIHNHETITQVAQDFLVALRGLIHHCSDVSVGMYTPSDFPLVRIEQEEITHLITSASGTTGRLAKQAIEDVYPLAPLQQGMLFHALYAPEGGIYFEQVVLELSSDVDLTALHDAWNMLLERHTILRTAFVWEGLSDPVQIVHKSVELPWQHLHWQAVPATEQSSYLDRWLEAERTQGFNLAQPPLLKLTIIEWSSKQYHLVWSFHHLLLDGWSVPLLAHELFTIYNMLRQDQLLDLPSPRPYRDYISWVQSQDSGAAEQFWRDYLVDFAEPTVIGIDKASGYREQSASDIQTQVIRLADDLTHRIDEAIQTFHLTLNIFLQGTWGYLLSCYSGTNDVVFGTTVSGRPAALPKVEQIIGLFINTLPVRVYVTSTSTRMAWLQQLHQQQQELLSHDYVSLNQIQSWSDVPGGTALFETLFIFENFPVDDALQQESSHIPILDSQYIEQTNYPLTFVVLPGTPPQLRVQYNQKHFDAASIQRLLAHFQHILFQLVDEPYALLTQIDLLSAEERQQVLVDWNATEVGYPQGKGVHQAIVARAAQYPDAIAIVSATDTLTFQALYTQANALAAHLRTIGVHAEVPVGLCLERTPALVVGMLAVWLAGGAYVPLDPDYPSDRIAAIVREGGLPVLLSQRSLQPQLPTAAATVLWLDELLPSITSGAPQLLAPPVHPASTAYILYTSGSTGIPKGVQIPHCAIENHMYWFEDQFPLTETDRVFQKTPFGFDASVWEFLAPLRTGAQLILAEPGGHRDPWYLVQAMATYQITIVQLVPSLAEALLSVPELAAGRSVRRVFCGGEALRTDVAATCAAVLGVPVYNLYGPTETTIDATWWTYKDDDSGSIVPIGRPVANLQTYVVDTRGHLAVVGVPGELQVGGIGVARGYVHAPAQTAAVFIPDNWSGTVGSRVYRTGDVVHWDVEGALRFVGRRDEQVKLRGYRVELGEVTAALRRIEDVAQAEVVVQTSAGGTAQLVAYVVLCVGVVWTAAVEQRIQRELESALPSYMVPSAYVSLTAFPLTPSGKIDRKALPAPIRDNSVSFVEAQTTVERQLAAIWQKVLGVKQVSIHDNFFRLGGDSIVSIQVVAQARQQGLMLSPRDIFTYPTIAELVQVTSNKGSDVIDQSEVTGPLMLTPIQRWLLDQSESVPHHFNQSVLLQIPTQSTGQQLSQVVAALLAHHDGLRMRLQQTASEWRAWYVDSTEAGNPLIQIDLTAIPDTHVDAIIKQSCADFQNSLDLLHGPLFRVVYFDLGMNYPGRLLLIAHHLVVDRSSWTIILEDLHTAMDQANDDKTVLLPEKTTSYQHWGAVLSEYAISPQLTEDVAYWSEVLTTPVASLPSDYCEDIANLTAKDISYKTTVLDKKTTQALLDNVPAAYNTQTTDILLTALAQALTSWTGDRRLRLNVEFSGRMSEQFVGVNLTRTVGWFATLYPVLLDVGLDTDPESLLCGVKEQLRAVPNHGIGYGVLRYMAPSDVAEVFFDIPEPDVLFTYIEPSGNGVDSEAEVDFTILSDSESTHISQSISLDTPLRYTFQVNTQLVAGQLIFTWCYSNQIHTDTTINQITTAYMSALQALIVHCSDPHTGKYTPSDFPLVTLSQSDLSQILVDATGATGRTAKNAIANIYPVSPLQEGMLFHALYTPESGIYFQHLVLHLHRSLDLAIFQAAWDYVIQRHAIFRTGFQMGTDGTLVQIVHQTVNVLWHDLNWQHLSPADQTAELERWLAVDRAAGFDLAQPPLMRFTVIHTTDDHAYLVWSHHHLLLDGWSTPLVVRDLLIAYESLQQGYLPSIELPRPYRDYIGWVQQQDREEALAFWQDYLADVSEPTVLSIDQGSGVHEQQAVDVQEQTVWLPTVLSTQLEQGSQQAQVTLNVLLQAAWGYLLSRYSGSDDVVFGTTVSGRPAELPGVEEMVGLFINTVPVRMQVANSVSRQTWVQTLQQQQHDLLQYAYVPLTQIQGWSTVSSGTPLFETLLVFENYPVDRTAVTTDADLEVGEMSIQEQTNYPITLMVVPRKALQLRLAYHAGRFGTTEIARLLDHLQQVLTQLVATPTAPVATLSLLAPEERQHLLTTWATPTMPPFSPSTIPARFTTQVLQRPDAVALVAADAHLTYAVLAARSAQLAHVLQQHGVTVEVPVAVALPRSLDLVITLLAIVQAGGGYVALDASYPVARLQHMLVETQAPMLISAGPVAAALAAVAPLVLDLSTPAVQQAWQAAPTTAPAVALQPPHLAYVSYTSGSTGQPKGVQVPHQAVLRLVGPTTYATFGPDEVLVQLAPVAFDASTLELWGSLLNGARLVVAPAAQLDTDALAAWLAQVQATLVWLTAGLFHQLVVRHVELLRGIRQLLAGGEVLQPDAVRAVLTAREQGVLINGYGPTENTTFSSCAVLTNPSELGTTVPIGQPIAYSSSYVLDTAGGVVPPGVLGELYVGGWGLARGYVRQASTTAAAFVPDHVSGAVGQRLYRTGDIVQWAAGGTLTFLGRRDQQVKVRGYRIELGEIAAVLTGHPGVAHSDVVVYERASGSRQVVGYIVPQEATADPTDLVAAVEAQARAVLPTYMVPSALVVLKALPLTPNGKVDRPALPDPHAGAAAQDQVAPRNAVEAQLGAIWQATLGVATVGVHENFFQLGGDSIISIQVVARAKQAGLGLTPRDVFSHPTIAELAQVVTTGDGVPADQGVVTGTVPLTPIQRWFLDQPGPAPQHFNQAVLVQVSPTVTAALLMSVVAALVAHHDGLRLRVRPEPTQEGWTAEYVDPAVVGVPLVQVDLTGVTADQQTELIEASCAAAQASLDLAAGRLVRLVHFDLGADTLGRLLVVAHHLVVDGVSWRILLEDLQTAVDQLQAGQTITLPAKTTAFQQWAQALAAYAASATLAAEHSYWQAVHAAEVPALPVDTLVDRTQLVGGETATVSIVLDAATTQALLQQVPAAYNTQINDILLTALAQALTEWTGGTQVRIALEGHGRHAEYIPGDELDVTRTVGWFTTLYPVLLDLGGEPELGVQVCAIKEQLRAIPQQGLGYGLLRYLGTTDITKALSQSALPEVSFNYLGQFDQVLNDETTDADQAAWEMAPEDSGSDASPLTPQHYLLNVNSQVFGGQLALTWSYSPRIHDAATIVRLTQSFEAALRGLIAHCADPQVGGYTPSDFPLITLSPSELTQLLSTVSGHTGRAAKVAITDVYPVALLQEGLLFHALYAPDSGIYFEQLVMELGAEMDIAALHMAWQQVVQRHASLRTAFVWEGVPTPLQVVQREVILPWAELDWRHIPTHEQVAHLDRWLAADRTQGFALTQAPLMRWTVLRQTATQVTLVWSFHHLLLDGWSMPLVQQDLLAAYMALREGQSVVFPPLRPYRDYIAWLQRQDQDEAARFWQTYLADFTDPTVVGIDRAPGLQSQTADDVQIQSIAISSEMTAKLEQGSRAAQVTLNVLFQAAWSYLLSRYSGSDDVVFGTTVSGRPAELPGVESMVGLFINTIPVRVHLPPQISRAAWLQQLQQQQQNLLQYDYVPLAHIQSWSAVARGTALFEILFIFENYPVSPSEMSDIAEQQDVPITDLHMQERTNYPLALIIVPGSITQIKLEHHRQRFDATSIIRLLEQLRRIFMQLVDEPTAPLASISLLSDAERQHILVDWNTTQTVNLKDVVLHQMVVEQARLTPDAVAVVTLDTIVTYQELLAQATHLAVRLQDVGVGADVRVGICLPRSADMVVSVLAVLLAGGAYVPLDPNYPSDRLTWMLNDSAPAALLTHTTIVPQLPILESVPVYCLDALPSTEPQNVLLSMMTQQANLAYLIYTSGSTGTPKGVAISHRNVATFLTWAQTEFACTDHQWVLAATSLNFDLSVFELFYPLTTGRTIILVENALDFIHHPAALSVTLVNTVPSAIRELLRQQALPPTVTTVNLAGEALPGPLVHQIYTDTQVQKIYNLYGPSEDTTYSTYTQIRRGELSPPIGTSIANAQAYVLDRWGQPVPIGIAGELFLGGTGLARGYWSKPDQTAAVFLPNPFSDAPGMRLYRTGDQTRWRADGQLEYLGRFDNQVKVRGFRIELGEIETALSRHEGVEAAAVVVHVRGEAGQQLVAYVVPTTTGSQQQDLGATLQAALQQHLPGYMIPALYIQLDAMPLTPNGKLDRRALPLPEDSAPPIANVFPRTVVEKQLVEIWQHVLGLDSIGIYDNFFAVGGDSINSMQIVARASRQELSLSPRDIFENPTIAQLAQKLETNEHTLEQELITGDVFLTPNQQWFFAQQSDSKPYQYYFMIARPQGLHYAQLQTALGELLQHHDALRLAFTKTEEGWKQTHTSIHETLQLPIVDISNLSTTDRLTIIAGHQQSRQSHDLVDQQPLVVAKYFDCGTDPGCFLLGIHRLVTDVSSQHIVFEDLTTLWEQLRSNQPLQLPPKTTPFKRWSERLHVFAQSEQLADEVDYWIDMARLSHPEHQTGDDLPADEVAFNASDYVTDYLTTEETDTLIHDALPAYNTQVRDILLTALTRTIATWSGNAHLSIEIEDHSRVSPFADMDISRTVGWMTPSYPVLFELNDSDDIGTQICMVKEQIHQVPHYGLGYAMLRSTGSEAVRRSLAVIAPSIMFSYWELSGHSLTQDDSIGEFSTLGNTTNRDPYLFVVRAQIQEGQLHIIWEFSPYMYQAETITSLVEQFFTELRCIIDHCIQPYAGKYTPSDFPLIYLSQSELDHLMASNGSVETAKSMVEDAYPLSPMQQGMLFHDLYTPETSVYCNQFLIAITSDIDIDTLVMAWQAAVQHYAVLRTAFVWQQLKTPVQIVFRATSVPDTRLDWGNLPEQEGKDRLEQWLTEDRQRGFKLAQAPLMRLTFIRLSQQIYFIWSYHHILFDGWSQPLILRDVFTVYDQLIQGRQPSLPATPPYREYIAWLQRQDMQQTEVFWRRMLADFTTPTPFGIDYESSNDTDTFDVNVNQYTILSSELSEALNTLTRQSKVTMNTLMQGAWALLLSQYSNTSDILFGATTAGRSANIRDIDKIVGLFINTLPVRIQMRWDTPLVDWLQQLQEQQAEYRNYDYTPLAQIQSWSDVPSGTPLFESIVVFENMPDAETVEEQSVDLTVNDVQAFGNINYPLSLSVIPHKKIVVDVEYDRKRFTETTITRMLKHLQHILEQFVAKSTQQVGSITLLTATEYHQVLYDWNSTAVIRPAVNSYPERFTQQATSTPDAVALVQGNTTLTYSALEQFSNQLAHLLWDKGVDLDMPVGICLPRSLELAITLLAILKAGGAYVPLDPKYPQERLTMMCQEAHLQYVVTNTTFVERLPTLVGSHVLLDHLSTDLAGYNTCPPDRPITGDNLAYIIFTSGSTGTPKGVMVSHQSMLNHNDAIRTAFALTPRDRVLQFATINFDTSVEEIFPTWLSGATLVLCEGDLPPGPSELTELVATTGITVLDLPTAYWHTWVATANGESLASCPSLRWLVVGGEAAHVERYNTWRQQVGTRVRWLNTYGPTETTVVATLDELATDKQVTKIPIGRPIANVQAYIVSDRLQPVPVGVPGELWLGGAGVARGYLNRADLTAASFGPNPFSKLPGARLYRTGDGVRYIEDGRIEYIGRIDRQVKIRGFRVELREIETILERHPRVAEVVVDTQVSVGEVQQLVAYVVTRKDTQEALTVEALRAYLQQHVPEYMVPGSFVHLDGMPLTPSGKVDRRALPQLSNETLVSQTTYAAPQNETEQALAAIWQEMLGLQRVGRHDNFFALGGDSIVSIQVVARASQAGLRLTPRDLFTAPTIATLSPRVRTAPALVLPQGPVTGSTALLPIQHDFLAQPGPAPHHFNQAVLLQTPTTLDYATLRQVWTALLSHHDGFRLRLTATDQGWQGSYGDPTTRDLPLHAVDLSSVPAAQHQALIEQGCAWAQTSLDLTAGPLVRVLFWTLGAGLPGRLLLVAHHLVVDGVSWRIVLEDLQTAVAQVQAGQPVHLPAKTTSFQQWTQTVTAYAASATLAAERAFWHRVVSTPVPALPRDGTTEWTTVTVRDTTHVQTVLDATLTQQLLRETAAAYHTQIQEVLLTALAQAMTDWTGDRRVRIALEGHGRVETLGAVDVTRTVGWFTTLYPVLLELEDATDLGTQISAVKEQLRAIPQQGIGYGILRWLAGDAELAGAPAPEILFNYLGQFDQVLVEEQGAEAAEAQVVSGWDVAPEWSGPPVDAEMPVGHLLEVNGQVSGGQLVFTWTYSPQVHSVESIAQVTAAFTAALEKLIAHCRDPQVGQYTPSDFGLVRLRQAEVTQVVTTVSGRTGRAAKDAIADLYPLAPMQQGMLFHALYAPTDDIYLEQVHVHISDIDVKRFIQAWQIIVDRHAVLRTAFVWKGVSDPIQVVCRRVQIPVVELDWRDKREEETLTLLDEWLDEDRRQGFDLQQAPLMRLAFMRTDVDSYFFVWTHHHLLLDGWSLPILIREIFAAYEALLQDTTPQFEPIRPYRDYIEWLTQQDMAQAQGFWQQYLLDFAEPTALTFPTKDPSGPVEGMVQLQLSLEATEKLNTFARDHSLTLNTMVQGAWAVVLSGYGNSDEVVFGTTVAGRPAGLLDVEQMIGLFINTIPLRTRIKPYQSCLAWLQQLQDQQSESRNYDYAPLQLIQTWSMVPAGTPLFESLVVFENYPVNAAFDEQSDYVETGTDSIAERTNYPITIVGLPGHTLTLRVQYNEGRCDDQVAQQILDQLAYVLRQFVDAPIQPLSQLSLLCPEERQQVLDTWNVTVDTPAPQTTLLPGFAAQCVISPDAIALSEDESALSYDTLSGRVNQLAHFLQAHGVGPDVPVAVLLPRSSDLVVAYLAILVAGGAYVPLDPSIPVGRITLILEDTQTPLLLTTQTFQNILPPTQAKALNYAELDRELLEYPLEAPLCAIQPDHLAYVIYTSGSTGTPKGVGISHAALMNLVVWHQRVYEVHDSDRTTHLAGLAFDAAMVDLWPYLLKGARIMFPTPEVHADLPRLLEWEVMQAVTTTYMPTPLLEAALSLGWEGHPGLRCVLTGGDKLHQSPSENSSFVLVNNYGPTENTVVSTWQEVEPAQEGIPPIGIPVDRVYAYLFDPRSNPVGVGVPGELCVGGANLARGYWQHPDLTARSFVPDHISDTPGARLYRTGDLTCWQSDGQLLFLGRIDQQVKVRGYRIEIGEIEIVLQQHAHVQEAVVVASATLTGMQLTGYVTPETLDVEMVRDYLSERIPEYMIPQRLVALEKLPLTANGKIDRRTLQEQAKQVTMVTTEYVAPRNETEQTLVDVWSSVLSVERVGIHDNFFDLGGHSLLAIQIIARVDEVFPLNFTLEALLEHLTIAEMAEYIDTLQWATQGTVPEKDDSSTEFDEVDL